MQHESNSDRAVASLRGTSNCPMDRCPLFKPCLKIKYICINYSKVIFKRRFKNLHAQLHMLGNIPVKLESSPSSVGDACDKLFRDGQRQIYMPHF